MCVYVLQVSSRQEGTTRQQEQHHNASLLYPPTAHPHTASRLNCHNSTRSPRLPPFARASIQTHFTPLWKAWELRKSKQPRKG